MERRGDSYVISEDVGPVYRGPTGLLEQHGWTTISLGPKLTKQGVRDLNGPRMNGTGYNGHRSTTCPHHRDPQSVPQYTRSTMSVDDKGFPVTLYATCCSLCGSELAADEG